MKAAREAWFEDQPNLDPARLIVIDGTWTAATKTCTYGRCLRGQRLRSAVPDGDWRTATFPFTGLRLAELVAPFVLNGSINCVAVQAYVTQGLVPDRSASSAASGSTSISALISSGRGIAAARRAGAAGISLRFVRSACSKAAMPSRSSREPAFLAAAGSLVLRLSFQFALPVQGSGMKGAQLRGDHPAKVVRAQPITDEIRHQRRGWFAPPVCMTSGLRC